MVKYIKYASQITKAWIKGTKGANGEWVVEQMNKVFQGAIDNMIEAENKLK